MIARWFAVSLAALLLTADAEAAERTIYRCSIGGVTTFSDRPCGGSMVVHSLDSAVGREAAVGGASAGNPRHTVPARELQATRGKAVKRSSNGKDAHALECARLDALLGRLRARMRAGYSGTEGERLRELYRTQRGRRRELSCG